MFDCKACELQLLETGAVEDNHDGVSAKGYNPNPVLAFPSHASHMHCLISLSHLFARLPEPDGC